MKKKVTLQDVARAAHVSVATVSRVLTGGARVNPEIAERVKIAGLGILQVRKRAARTKFAHQ